MSQSNNEKELEEIRAELLELMKKGGILDPEALESIPDPEKLDPETSRFIEFITKDHSEASQRYIEAMRQEFENRGFKYWEKTDKDGDLLLFLKFQGENFDPELKIRIDRKMGELSIQCMVIKLNPIFKMPLAELLARINSRLKIGKYIIFMNDVIFMHLIPIRSGVFDPDEMQLLISNCVRTLDNEYPMIEQIAHGHFSADYSMKLLDQMAALADALAKDTETGRELDNV